VIIGGSLLVSVPLGQYDSNRLLNISSHRWSFKPELGISKRWDRFIFEAAIAGTFYTDNHAFFGQNERAQDPIGSAQLHAIYSTKRGIWGSLDFTYYAGGKVHLNGESKHDIESNSRLGGTIAIPVNPYNSIKLYGSAGVTARTGGRFDVIGAAWQVRWGGGL
jgi:hypothetical protein